MKQSILLSFDLCSIIHNIILPLKWSGSEHFKHFIGTIVVPLARVKGPVCLQAAYTTNTIGICPHFVHLFPLLLVMLLLGRSPHF